MEPVSNVVVTVSNTDLVEFNSSVRLSCSSSGSSRSFLWLNSSSEVTASDRVQLTDGNSTLTIVSVTRYDQGPFRCHVSNPVSSVTSGPILLSIYGRISSASVTSTSTQPIEGTSFNLTCEAAGSVVNRKWKKGDSYVLPDHIKFYDNNRVLSFQPLKKTDNGEYSCEISNPVSSDTAKYIMTVIYGPENVQTAGPSEIRLNQTLTLICSAESTPAASYTWNLNGTEIRNSAVFIKVITKLSDSGQYTCEARNIITGKTSSAVHGLTVTALPDKPSSCSAGCIAGIVIACLVIL
ncbi:pregnancy-specific beta-1-glycoprotein 8-like [Larimichthys crocea]|uniref:pregnancy-specific beta-1-glycoprotein 8-like n=1 Tax=Larimichthys crocea TaxID=215358 RepID=UPI000F5D69D9|nr:pregnancy-specific beta-1-glycoprotein 8-like [Larimichthys crocea]